MLPLNSAYFLSGNFLPLNFLLTRLACLSAKIFFRCSRAESSHEKVERKIRKEETWTIAIAKLISCSFSEIINWIIQEASESSVLEWSY